MKVTVYKDVPSRVWSDCKPRHLATTKAYKRIMDEIGRAMKDGAAVEFESTIHDPNDGCGSRKAGDVYETINVRIEREAEAPALAVAA